MTYRAMCYMTHILETRFEHDGTSENGARLVSKCLQPVLDSALEDLTLAIPARQ